MSVQAMPQRWRLLHEYDLSVRLHVLLSTCTCIVFQFKHLRYRGFNRLYSFFFNGS